MPQLARLLTLWLVLAWCLLAAPAWGQSMSLPNTAFEIEREDPRPEQEKPLRISRQDCLDSADRRFGDGGIQERGNFTWVVMEPIITGTIAQNAFLQVWVSEGAKCTDAQERAANGNCTIVYDTSTVLRNNTIVINPRDLVARNRDKVYEQGLELPESICSDPNNLVDRALSIYILLRSGSDTVDDNVIWEQTSVDLAAPRPPDKVKAAPGDEHLFFEWEISSQNEDLDTIGFVLYCVPTGTMSEVGMGGTSSTDDPDPAMGGAPAALTCDQNILVDGEFPPADAGDYECGKVIGRSARRGDAGKNIDNYVQYAVAVAAYDTVGNSGALRVFNGCLMPQEVTTFYEGYRAAGGKGGGGFCAYDPQRTGSWALLLALGVAVLFVSRRKTTA
jgi:hypothetical protein